MTEKFKAIAHHEIDEIVGMMSGMFDMTKEQENFYKGELLEFADLIATAIKEV